MLKKALSLYMALIMILFSVAAIADEAGLYDKNTAYILNPPSPPKEPKTKHEFINILMLGVDFGVRTPGKGKKRIKNCHADSVIMVAVDLTANKINLISVPRDTLTYVDGAYGVYKLNAAINCAPDFEQGIETAKNTVSRLLGGIRADHYVVIAPQLVEEIGDRIGGLDINVEMSYIGHSGTQYEKGMQHLDGTGIMDYSRARRNATKNNNDYGRTKRQRTVLNALFEKVSRDLDLVYDVLDVIVENFDDNFFSDLSVADLMDMMSLTEQLASGSISNYEMSGEIGMAMKYFNSSFFDTEKRKDIIRKVYGVSIDDLRLNSREYLNYLHLHGFKAIKAIRVSSRVIEWAQKKKYTGDELNNAITARKQLIDKFSEVDDTLNRDTTIAVEKRTDALKVATAELRTACKYPEKLSWSIVETDKWYLDPDINQYNDIDWN